MRSFTKDDSYTNGQLYLLDFAIVPSQTLIVQIPENMSADYAGHPNLPSNEFQVLNCESDVPPAATWQVPVCPFNIRVAFCQELSFGVFAKSVPDLQRFGVKRT